MAMTGIGDIKVPRVPMLAGERVVAVGHAGLVHLLDLDSGQTIWTQALGRQAGASACDGQPVCVTISDEIVIAGSVGHVFALKLEDGSVLWHTEHRGRGAGDTSLAVGGPGGDYVARLGS
jgi:outer membrane protein assembly factor BamB